MLSMMPWELISMFCRYLTMTVFFAAAAYIDSIDGHADNYFPPELRPKDDIATLRAPTSSFPTPASDEALSANGFFRVEQRRVASVPGAPDINLLMCLPKARTSPTPAFYYVHGGGLRRRRRSSRAIVAVLRWRARS